MHYRKHHLAVKPLISFITAFTLPLLAALALSGCCSEADLPRFKKGLYSSTAKERSSAALSLARCGSKAEDQVGRLGTLLYDDNVGVQSAAAYALRKIDSPQARLLLKKTSKFKD